MIDKLTFEKAVELKLNPIGCVKYYFPEFSNELCDFVLYERTCFPFSTEIFLNQLYDLYKNDTLHEDLPTDL